MKTSGFALGFQHFPQDLANVNEWKIMFDPSIQTHFAYTAQCLQNLFYSATNHSYQSFASYELNCHCKMMSVMVVDGVTSFLRLKDVKVKHMAEFLQCNGGRLEEAEECLFE